MSVLFRFLRRSKQHDASFHVAGELPILRDASVPDAAGWPARGIAGQPICPGYENTWVLVERIDEPVELPYAYRLWLPSPEISLTGEPIDDLGDLSDDHVHPSGAGGLIDLASRALQVKWSVRDEEWDAASRWYTQRFKELNDSLSPKEKAELAAIFNGLKPITPLFMRRHL